MKNKYLLLVTIALFLLFGCKAKEQQPEVGQMESEDLNIPIDTVTLQEEMSMPPAPAASAPQVSAPQESPVTAQPIMQELSMTAMNIQKALKNAGLYQGEVDGKIGPKTKMAIEDFQAKNGLKVDGKVGPMTWDKLKVYLSTTQ